MPTIKLNEIFDLEISCHERHYLEIENVLRDNNYKYHRHPSAHQFKVQYFFIYNVGIKQCCIIQKLLNDKKISTYS